MDFPIIAIISIMRITSTLLIKPENIIILDSCPFDKQLHNMYNKNGIIERNRDPPQKKVVGGFHIIFSVIDRISLQNNQ